jgi:DNA-directed RNA polymerase beta subunit
MSINVIIDWLLAIKYPLEKFHSSNQNTYMVHRPTVQEGQWVEKGDILADNSSSQQGISHWSKYFSWVHTLGRI